MNLTVLKEDHSHKSHIAKIDFSQISQISRLTRLIHHTFFMNYPQYFRKAGRCIRVDSPTKSWTIGLPPEFKVPVRSCDNHSSPEHLSHLIKDLDNSTEEEFKSFLFSFYKSVAVERELMSKAKESV